MSDTVSVPTDDAPDHEQSEQLPLPPIFIDVAIGESSCE